MLQAPTRGTIGSVDFSVDNGAANTWLPSTIGRATFGLYRSPLIYLREVY
jgi:MSHA biogenesis protein MshQ